MTSDVCDSGGLIEHQDPEEPQRVQADPRAPTGSGELHQTEAQGAIGGRSQDWEDMVSLSSEVLSELAFFMLKGARG